MPSIQTMDNLNPAERLLFDLLKTDTDAAFDAKLKQYHDLTSSVHTLSASVDAAHTSLASNLDGLRQAVDRAVRPNPTASYCYRSSTNPPKNFPTSIHTTSKSAMETLSPGARILFDLLQTDTAAAYDVKLKEYWAFHSSSISVPAATDVDPAASVSSTAVEIHTVSTTAVPCSTVCVGGAMISPSTDSTPTATSVVAAAVFPNTNFAVMPVTDLEPDAAAASYTSTLAAGAAPVSPTAFKLDSITNAPTTCSTIWLGGGTSSTSPLPGSAATAASTMLASAVSAKPTPAASTIIPAASAEHDGDDDLTSAMCVDPSVLPCAKLDIMVMDNFQSYEACVHMSKLSPNSEDDDADIRPRPWPSFLLTCLLGGRQGFSSHQHKVLSYQCSVAAILPDSKTELWFRFMLAQVASDDVFPMLFKCSHGAVHHLQFFLPYFALVCGYDSSSWEITWPLNYPDHPVGTMSLIPTTDEMFIPVEALFLRLYFFSRDSGSTTP